MVIVRKTVVVGVAVVGLSVGVDVADPVGEAGVGVAVAGRDSGVLRGIGVDVVLVEDVVMDLDSWVVVADGGVAAGVAGFTEQAVRTARNRKSVQNGSLTIALPLTAKSPNLMERPFRNCSIDINYLVTKLEPLSQHIYCGLRYEGSTSRHR